LYFPLIPDAVTPRTDDEEFNGKNGTLLSLHFAVMFNAYGNLNPGTDSTSTVTKFGGLG
jgi:hypothetical protein